VFLLSSSTKEKRNLTGVGYSDTPMGEKKREEATVVMVRRSGQQVQVAAAV
jgi:hypothetical protein